MKNRFINEKEDEVKTGSILIVDDEKDTRETLGALVERSGHAVSRAADGKAALAQLQDQDFDLIFSDIRMPGMSGLDLLKAIRKQGIETPVVMLTGFGSVENAVEAMHEGASDYLLKPVSAEVLARTCQTHLRKQPFKASADGMSSIVTRDPGMLRALELIQKVAPSDATVLICGETGTGKELFAARVHAESGRMGQSYLAMNCAALPEQLAESELFGHEKGAFTGAISQKIGKFEQAHKGTLVLDEISEMPLSLQAKLLRVLQQREIDRVGGRGPITIDTRIIALSNVDLVALVKSGKFREDLYYRINVVPIRIPPLRERRDDIPLLAEHFLDIHTRKNNKRYDGISTEAMALLLGNEWPGNVRELENTIARAVLIGSGPQIQPDDFLLDVVSENRQSSEPLSVGKTVKEVERELITQTLEQLNHNRTHAAKMLGISIRTLRNKLKEYEEDLQKTPAAESSTL